jgi:hypothetical protein
MVFLAQCDKAAILTRPCPLWVKSRHSGLETQCPLYPRKRTFEGAISTSALCQKPTLTCEQIQNIRGRSCNDRYLAGSQRGRFHRLWTLSRVSEGRANAYRDATAPEAV